MRKKSASGLSWKNRKRTPKIVYRHIIKNKFCLQCHSRASTPPENSVFILEVGNRNTRGIIFLTARPDEISKMCISFNFLFSYSRINCSGVCGSSSYVVVFAFSSRDYILAVIFLWRFGGTLVSVFIRVQLESILQIYRTFSVSQTKRLIRLNVPTTNHCV